MEKIAAGKTASIYRISDTQVLKLYEEKVSQTHLERERAAMTLAHAAGLPAVLPGELIEHNGRLGFTMPLVQGLNGMERIYGGADIEEEARLLARLQAQVHQTDGTGLLSTRQRLTWILEDLDISPELRAHLLAVLNTLPDGTALLHGDFHPGNLSFTETGPVILDWPDATQGAPVFDVARCLVLFGWGIVTDPIRQNFTQTYLDEYQRVSTTSLDRLDDALLICRAARLNEGAEENPVALRSLIESR
ncbi:MAG: aminoglycoside phosphotransferase family protein [Armatimonas sp.]